MPSTTHSAPSAAPDERRQLTVVFTDLVGSTELASALDPEDWHEVLDAYQHRVASIVTAHGGVIAQFQGDGAVAYFGYPEAVESAGRDAVSAGLAVVEDMERLTAELPPDLDVGELHARAGVHTGEVEVRPDDIVGLAVTIARRICDLARPGQALVSEAVKVHLMGSGIAVSEQGCYALKGVPGEWRLFTTQD